MESTRRSFAHLVMTSLPLASTRTDAAPGSALEKAILKRMIPTRGDVDAAFLSQFR